MNHSMKCILETLILFCIGGGAYLLVEILYRGYTHPTMFVLGGLCFLVIGLLNELYPWEMPLISQMFISMLFVTGMEFIFGMLLNVVLGLGIWDYSNMPYNLCGQICLLFSVAWFFLSIPAIIVDDWIRHWIFREERPVYNLFYVRIPNYNTRRRI